MMTPTEMMDSYEQECKRYMAEVETLRAELARTAKELANAVQTISELRDSLAQEQANSAALSERLDTAKALSVWHDDENEWMAL